MWKPRECSAMDAPALRQKIQDDRVNFAMNWYAIMWASRTPVTSKAGQEGLLRNFDAAGIDYPG